MPIHFPSLPDVRLPRLPEVDLPDLDLDTGLDRLERLLNQRLNPQPGVKPYPTLAPVPANAPVRRGEWTQDRGKRVPHDPVNLYVHAKSLDQLQRSFERAGWTKTDQSGAKLKRGLLRLAVNPDDKEGWRLIQSQPVSEQVLGGRNQVAAFAKENQIYRRHHFRVFDTGRKDPAGNKVFAIAASRDSGTRFKLGLNIGAGDWNPIDYANHQVEPNADGERNTVANDLRRAGVVQSLSAWKASYGKQRKQLFSLSSVGYDVVLR